MAIPPVPANPVTPPVTPPSNTIPIPPGWNGNPPSFNWYWLGVPNTEDVDYVQLLTSDASRPSVFGSFTGNQRYYMFAPNDFPLKKKNLAVLYKTKIRMMAIYYWYTTDIPIWITKKGWEPIY